jgi:D-3-phosphoglycerate dehydrogenase
MRKVLITDYAWPDLAIEAAAVEAAGFELVAGPAVAAPAEAIARLSAEHRPVAILTCWARVSAEAIAYSPELKVVSRLGVGLDNIDVAACTDRGIWVTNVPDYCIEEVSDHAVGLLLAWSRGLVAFDRSVKGGAWNPSSARLRRLGEMTLGVIGYGRIARRSIDKLRPWGCRILVNNRSRVPDPGLEQVDLAELMARSDAIVLHVPLIAQTHHLINDRNLAAVKRGAFLVNVSRGAVVDTAALLRALADGRLSGAGLDVLEDEPDPPREVAERPDVIITPHIAFSSDAAITELRRRATACALAVLEGNIPPPNACNRPVGTT